VKHTPEQITAKLGEAEALAAAGRTQAEIAKVLGVSVMTFHRWRHARAQKCAATSGHEFSGGCSLAPEADRGPIAISRLAELQIENARLRKLVTDLLLEKMSLEEGVQVLPRRMDEVQQFRKLRR
jgi:putative transposase